MKWILPALLITVSAQATEYRCPRHIESDQTPKSSAEGWISWPEKLNRKQVLEMVDVFSGHPDEGVDLVPDNEYDRQGSFRWTLKGVKKSVWMACVYTQTFVRYIKKLPQDVKSCRLLFEPEDSPMRKRVVGLNCE